MGLTSVLYQWLAPAQPAMVEELGTYVNMESGSWDKAGVDQVGQRLAEEFAALGFTIERLSQPDLGDHLVARRAGRGVGRVLVLLHLDTVWPRGTLTDTPFRVENGRAYGPGVLDMKGGWVVLLWALRALAVWDWQGLEQLTVFMTSDEELGSPTGRPWIEREAHHADWCLVMEPAREDGSLVIQRGMVGAVYLEVYGKTAHAAAGERGASAIEEIAHKIIALQRLTDRERGVLVSVGTVHGGSARQVVPDRAEISVDVRAPTAALAEEVMARIQTIAERCYVPGTRTVLHGGITRPAFEPNAGTWRLFELARRCGAELGLDLRGSATRAGSDGNFAAALGVPTLDGLGPEGANVCSREEYVVVESLPQRAALLAGILAGLPELR